jgi:DnaK suppressor protein
MITSKKKEHFKDLLSKMLDDLSQDHSRKMMEIGLLHDKFPDPADQAIADREKGIHLHMRERDRGTMVEIREALDKIRSGTYGICELCEGEIAVERLEAQPTSTLCIE